MDEAYCTFALLTNSEYFWLAADRAASYPGVGVAPMALFAASRFEDAVAKAEEYCSFATEASDS